MGRRKLAGAIVASSITAWTAGSAAQPIQLSQLADLPLEALASIEITSVSRRPESLLDAAASVYVITGEDIRRAGVTSLPEALRLAPNLQVARINASQYAISARGFNNAVGNKLLVLVDGRTIYTPLFSGVFWDQQDLMLEDVDRIEVISGPGATLWGANAVNGVINVITRPAGQTQGALAFAGAGNREQAAAARFGGAAGAGHYRVYAKARKLDHSRLLGGARQLDNWEFAQTGFRADWAPGADRLTLQGDFYAGRGQDFGTILGIQLGRPEVTGGNLLGRWSRELDSGSSLQVQAYLDHARREDRVLFQPDADIFDIELQHGIPWGRHRLTWGAGYRYARDKVKDAVFSGLRPASSALEWSNVFAQADFRLSETLDLTPGIKFERNDYTGTEYLPSVRLAWKASADRLVWGAVSRAVRAPSRFDRDVIIPAFPLFGVPQLDVGGPAFESEVADVYEIGYRAQASRSLTYSFTLFRHEWDKLRSAQLLPSSTSPFELRNQIEGSLYGLETWAAWQVAPAWRLSGGLTTLRKNLQLDPASNDPAGPANITLAADPEFQWNLRSAFDLGDRQQLDIMARRIGALPEGIANGTQSVDPLKAYTALDVRYAWKPRRDTELSLTLQNLQERWHAEFRTSPNPPSEIERGFFLAVRWQS